MVSIMRSARRAPYSRSIATLIACAWTALCGAVHLSGPAQAAGDAEEIRALIGKTWDKPGSKVETDPVVVSGAHAVASWTQAQHGGRALLRRGDKGWSVVLCSGDPLTQAAWLVEAGVPSEDARRLSRDLAAAEARIPDARRGQFSLFEGVVGADDAPHAATPHHPQRNTEDGVSP
jgi:hypothetical protein